MNTDNIELLSPAGSVRALKAVIEAGADAVYIGGTKFGARAYAENPDEEELVSAIDYAHKAGVRVYLTVNTLLKENEISTLTDYIRPYYIHGIDAVLVQDFGVLKVLHEAFPDMPLHASTQMTVTGPCSARLLGEYGVSRVVPARELSLEELRQIRRESGLEVEAFVHGAICVCYSGQCLMSSMIGGRSGNRGRCAQPCRLRYSLENDSGKTVCAGELLSPKDMCTLDYLPDMIEAGVCSFKIEGRMKQPEYAAGVTAIYRKYLDLYKKAGKEAYKVKSEDKKALLTLFNRDGFSDGYLMRHNGPDMMAINRKTLNHREEEERSRLYAELKDRFVDKDSALELDGRATVFTGRKLQLEITERRTGTSVSIDFEKVLPARTRPLSAERIGEQLNKTGGSGYRFVTLDIDTDGDSFVPMAQLNALRREAFADMDRVLLAPFMREEVHSGANASQIERAVVLAGGRAGSSSDTAAYMERTDESGLEGGKSTVVKADKERTGDPASRKVRISASVETEEQFEAVLRAERVETIYIPYSFISGRKTGRDAVLRNAGSYLDRASACGKRLYLAMPYVERRDGIAEIGAFEAELVKLGFAGFLVRSLETLARLREEDLAGYVRLDSSIGTFNREAGEFLAEFGFAPATVPVELNRKEIRNRDNTNSEMIVYGHLPLMVTAQCVMKEAGGPCHQNPEFFLKDRKGRKFSVRCDCTFCYNIIRNPVCLSLLGEAEFIRNAGINSVRLIFTGEAAGKVSEVLTAAIQNFDANDSAEISGEYTKGHFNRGVE